MGKKVVAITNFYKNCGGSLPPLLIISLWVFATYLLYPHQAPKAYMHTNVTNKQKKIKISIAKVPSKKIKTYTHTFAYSIQTPTPTIVQISTPSQQNENINNNTIPTISPTKNPAASIASPNN